MTESTKDRFKEEDSSVHNFAREELTASEQDLRETALAYPQTTEDFPWGHRAFKVKGKVFVFMGNEEGATSLSFKLPKSNKAALKNAFASPTHYGMGKHGWVTVAFDIGDSLPMELLKSWMEESYRSIAPKRVLALLENGNHKVQLEKEGQKVHSKRAQKKGELAVKRIGDSHV